MDPSGASAYIYLKQIGPGEVARSQDVDADVPAGAVVLDFDKDDRLIGIEILRPLELLPQELLEQAEQQRS
jgi:uncharacterized protein YuzE